MEGILEFLQSPLGMVILVVVLSIFIKDSALLNRILEILKIKNPTPPQALTVEENIPPDREDAFVASNVLVEYYETKPDCKEGLEAAKKAGQCLFH